MFLDAEYSNIAIFLFHNIAIFSYCNMSNVVWCLDSTLHVAKKGIPKFLQSRSSRIQPQHLIWGAQLRRESSLAELKLERSASSILLAQPKVARDRHGEVTIGCVPAPRVNTSVYAHVRWRDRASGLSGRHQYWRLAPRHMLSLRRSHTADRLAALAVSNSIGRLSRRLSILFCTGQWCTESAWKVSSNLAWVG